MAIFLDDGLHTLLGVQFLYFIDCNKNVSILFVHRELLCDGHLSLQKMQMYRATVLVREQYKRGRRRIRTADLIRLMRVSSQQNTSIACIFRCLLGARVARACVDADSSNLFSSNGLLVAYANDPGSRNSRSVEC